MNYYEEFGVSRNASAEQIKEAYRSLMRLLHPDRHTDPGLQRVADLQVKKLNQIYGVLSDPDRRRRYDKELDEGFERAAPIIIHAPPPPPRVMGIRRSSIPWLAAVAAFGVLLVWMASRPTPVEPAYNSGASIAETPAIPKTQPEPQPARPAAPQAVPAPKSAVAEHPVSRPSSSEIEAEQLRERLARLQYERDSALAQLEHARSAPKVAPAPPPSVRPQEQRRLVSVLNEPAPEIKPDPKRVTAPSSPVNLAAARPTSPVPSPTAQQPASQPQPQHERQRPPLLGSWVYRPQETPPKNKQLYPPEFIEAVINEDNGQIRGTYRARYKVFDRPVSPDVNFYFSGKLEGDSGSLPWSGAGGSKGEVTFKLMADHSLRVDWVASQLGALGFYRGTAVLVRRSD